MNGYRTTPSRRGFRIVALIAAIIGVLALAAAAFVLSYSGMRDVVLHAGVSLRLARIYPAMFDAVVVVAGVTALSLPRNRGLLRSYAWLAMLIAIGGVAAGDALHATMTHLPQRPTELAVAIAPWVLLLIIFTLLFALVRVALPGKKAADPAQPEAIGQAPAEADPVPTDADQVTVGHTSNGTVPLNELLSSRVKASPERAAPWATGPAGTAATRSAAAETVEADPAGVQTAGVQTAGAETAKSETVEAETVEAETVEAAPLETEAASGGKEKRRRGWRGRAQSVAASDTGKSEADETSLDKPGADSADGETAAGPDTTGVGTAGVGTTGVGTAGSDGPSADTSGGESAAAKVDPDATSHGETGTEAPDLSKRTTPSPTPAVSTSTAAWPIALAETTAPGTGTTGTAPETAAARPDADTAEANVAAADAPLLMPPMRPERDDPSDADAESAPSFTRLRSTPTPPGD
ncbi:MAG TPA: DUF2637 domain-containing protein [Streptosporangiaceae bacterium]